MICFTRRRDQQRSDNRGGEENREEREEGPEGIRARAYKKEKESSRTGRKGGREGKKERGRTRPRRAFYDRLRPPRHWSLVWRQSLGESLFFFFLFLVLRENLIRPAVGRAVARARARTLDLKLLLRGNLPPSPSLHLPCRSFLPPRVTATAP